MEKGREPEFETGTLRLGEEDDGALDGKVVPTIDLRRDYARMAARDYNGRQGTLLKLNEIKMLMDTLPSDATVSITAAAQLHKELLSQRGAGTMFRHGEHFTVHSSMDSVDGPSFCASAPPPPLPPVLLLGGER